MKIGYARVSTREQNLDRQIDSLTKAGCERIYQEKISGASVDRPEFKRMLDSIRSGDTVVVDDLSRLSRNRTELFSTIDFFKVKSVSLVSLTESWMDTTTSHGQLILTIMAGLSEFERACTMERAEKGRIAARARGTKFGRKGIDIEKIKRAELLRQQNPDWDVSKVCKNVGISTSAYYKHRNSVN